MLIIILDNNSILIYLYLYSLLIISSTKETLDPTSLPINKESKEYYIDIN